MMFQNFVNIQIKLAFSPKDIPVCQTRIVREGTGMPWEGRIAVHPLGDGKVELTPVKVPTTPKHEKDA